MPVLIALGLLSSMAANAQVNFAWTQTALPGGSLNDPGGLAVDSSGNIFVADTNNNAVKEILAAGGYTTFTTVGSGFKQPHSVAVDGSGNVFVADSGNSMVKEILAAGGYVAVNTLGSGFSNPYGIAVDKSGNVFVADTNNKAVKEILAAGGYTTVKTLASVLFCEGVAVDGSGNVFVADAEDGLVKEIVAAGGYTTIQNLGSGFNAPYLAPYNVAVDGSGNVFVAGLLGSAVKEILAAGGYTTINTLGGGLAGATGVALDQSGDVFVADNGNNQIVEINYVSANFGSVKIGSSNSLTLNYDIASAETLGTPKVLTMGTPNLDYTLASSNCTGSVTGGSFCAVNVTFSPKFAGPRNGAVQIVDGSGNVLTTTYIHGIGVGPQVTFANTTTSGVYLPSAQVSFSNLDGPYGVAVDGGGNIFLTTYGGTVEEILAAGGYTTVLTLASGFSSPQGIALDGSGNVFVTDFLASTVTEIVAAGGYTTSHLVGRYYFAIPFGVAVDGSGNLFVADQANAGVFELLAADGYTTVHNLSLGNQTYPYEVAVDGSENIFVTTSGYGTVLEMVAASGYTTINTVAAGLNYPLAVAVDASGNVFVNSGTNAVKEIVAAGGYTTINTLGSGFSGIHGVALDASGNVFVGDSYDNRVVKLDFADPPTLSFASTALGSTSSDSPQSVAIANVGNATLSAVAPGLLISPNFSQATGPGTPPDCSAAFSLLPSQMCNLSISFSPRTTIGPITGTATLTDNVLNAASVSQIIPLSGTGAVGAPAAVTPNAGSTPQSTPVNSVFPSPLSVTVKDSGGNLVSGANVTFRAPTSGAAGTFSNNATTITVPTLASGIASAGLFTANANGGTYNVTASVGGVSASFVLTNSFLGQNITFGSIATQTVGIPLTLAATATSKLPVSYSSTTTSSVCTVAAGVATFLTPGTCSITASQAGNATYSAAALVTQTFQVQPNAAVISAIQAVAIGGNSEMISWITDQPSTSQVNYGPTPSFGSSSPLSSSLVTSHSVTLTGLSSGSTYNYQVVSTNSVSETTNSANLTFTVKPLVAYVAFWGVNNSEVTISWSTDFAATSIVAFGTTPALGQTMTGQPGLSNSHGAVLTGLNSGTTYYFQARSTTADGSTGGSTIYSFTTTGAASSPAPIITNVAVSNITPTGATITWTTDQLSSSQVNYGTTTSYGSSSLLNSSLITAHLVTLTGLTPGVTYNYAVISTNSSGTSAGTSTNYTLTTTATVTTPPVISSPAAVNIGGTTATITWTTDQPSWSQVNYGTTSAYGTSSPLNTSLVTSHSVTLTGLAAGTTYHFNMFSTNAAGLSSTSSDMTFATLAANATPPQIGYVAFWGITNNGVTISWSTDVPANTDLAYGTSQSLNQLTPLQAQLAASHGVVLTGLNPGTTYYFQAQSTGANAATGYSTIYSFTTGGASSTPPPVISSVLATPATTSAVISWTTDEGASTQVNYGTTTSYSLSSTLDPAFKTAHSVTLTGLMPGTIYNFDVMSANAAGGTTTSTNYTFQTTGNAPRPVITAVTASGVTSGGAVITWTTDQASSSQVFYGATTAYGQASALNSTPVISHSVTLSGLTPNTIYNFDVASASVTSGASTSSNYTFTTSAATATPPAISDVFIYGVTSSGVSITWSTDVPANTSLAYGTSQNLTQSTPVQTALTNAHGVTLTNLLPDATYYFEAQSADVNGVVGNSTIYTFMTLSGGNSTISGVTVTPGTNNSATISWTNSTPGYSFAQYGPSAGNYNRYSNLSSLTTNPVVTLGYVPSGTIHYQLVVKDAAGNQVMSSDMTFVEP